MFLNFQINDNVEDGEYWKLQGPYFSNHLCNLKMVKVYNFMKNLNVLRSKQATTATEVLLEGLQNDMNFLRFLLKNSNALARLIITTCKNVEFIKSEGKKFRLLFELSQELLAFPRASQDAEISFS